MTGFTLSLRLASRALRCTADFHAVRPTRFHGDVQNPARLPFSVAPSVFAARKRYGNLYPLCFGYALRPRLSPRLTLGGQAFPRNPRAFGGGVSHPPVATHASILASKRSTRGHPTRFAPLGRLPYRRKKARVAFLRPAASALRLSPEHCRRAPTRPVSCYALFERMAASKPTSWLSGQAHILCH